MNITIAKHRANYMGVGDDKTLVSHTFRVCSTSLDYALLEQTVKGGHIDITIPASVIAQALHSNRDYVMQPADGRRKK